MLDLSTNGDRGRAGGVGGAARSADREPGPAVAAGRSRLSALREGERARIVSLASVLEAPQRRRLLDLGFTPGTMVAVELQRWGGETTAYRVRGALVALRREQAEQIEIERLDER